MEVKAHLRYLRISPRKVRLVANLIKGMSTARALLELNHLPKRSSEPMAKLLKSAIANAKHNFQLPEGDLYIKEILVNQGTVLRRFMPRAFGRAAPIRKRTSHISLTLDTRTAKPIKSVKKKEGPVVRDVTRDDIREDFIQDSHEEKPESGGKSFHKAKAKQTNFVKKVFKRTAV